MEHQTFVTVRRRAIVRAMVICAVSVPWPAAASKSSPLLVQPGLADYPKEALDRKLEGDVVVRLDITAQGAVTCRTPASGDLAILSQASCRLLTQRLALEPNRASDGKPVAATISAAVRWHLSNDTARFGGAIPIGRPQWVTDANYPPIARYHMIRGKVGVSFVISERGRVVDCRVTKPGRELTLDGAVCPLLERRALFLPAVDADGHPVRASGSFEASWGL